MLLLFNISFNINADDGVPLIIDNKNDSDELPKVLNILLNIGFINLVKLFNILEFIIMSFKMNIINKEGNTFLNHK